MTTIYRATKETETGIPSGTCWAEDYDVAVAYTDNPGFGGTHIRETELTGPVLDITGGIEDLAEALGYDDPAETAAEWRMNSWLYPWEESGKIATALASSGYDWLRYEDDYPEGAITLMRIS